MSSGIVRLLLCYASIYDAGEGGSLQFTRRYRGDAHLALQHAGFETIDAPLHEFNRGIEAGLTFLRTYLPDTVVFDISPPYERTASFCCDLQEVALQRAWVITSTNPARTARDLRTRSERYELIGKPYDLRDVVEAVHRAIQKNAKARL